LALSRSESFARELRADGSAIPSPLQSMPLKRCRQSWHATLLMTGRAAGRYTRHPTGAILDSMRLPHFQPLPVCRARAPFSHPHWLFEIKWDGFRALLYSDPGGVRLVSRNGNTFKSFRGLCEGLARDLKGRGCVLDGEIVCLDLHGKPQFRDLLFRRAEPMFYAFDLLWDTHAWSDDDQERRRFRNAPWRTMQRVNFLAHSDNMNQKGTKRHGKESRPPPSYRQATTVREHGISSPA